MQPLAFHGTTFDIIDRNGQPWLRGPQIGDALGYQKAGRISIHKLYESNAAEFTASMTAVVKLPTAGGEQDVRIFSLRGAHLLAMFARTARAAEFRRWVLDVLEAHTAQTPDTSMGSFGRGSAIEPPAPSLRARRFLVSIDDEGREHIQPVPDDAAVASRAQWPRLIRDPDFFASPDELRDIMSACFDRMGDMYSAQQQIAQIMRKRAALKPC